MGIAGVVEVGEKSKPTPAAASTPKREVPAAVGLGVGTGVATGIGVSTLAGETKNQRSRSVPGIDREMEYGYSGCFCPE